MKDLQLEFSLDAPQAEKSVKQPEVAIFEQHAVLLELPTLKAKLEYYNKNICSLALVRKVATYEEVELPTTDATTAQNGFTKSKELRLLPSVYYTPPFDLCTETDGAIFEPLRQKEIERLQAELDKRETYKEQLEYIVTEPGFDLQNDLGGEEIGLHPSGRTPEEIAEFNAVAEKEFEKKFLPTEYHNLLFEREKAELSKQLNQALNPKNDRNITLKAIEAYTLCKEADVWKRITIDGRDWEDESGFGLKELKRIVQQTFVRGYKGKGTTPNIYKKPFNNWEWAAWKHGQQMFLIYKWLKDWKPGQTEDPPKTKAEEKNIFCKVMPVDAAREHFRKLVNNQSKNGKPFLTEAALEDFIKRAFLGDTTLEKQVINLNPTRETGYIIDIFYKFYQDAISHENQWEDTPQCRDKYINLLVENFEGWDFGKVKNNFRGK